MDEAVAWDSDVRGWGLFFSLFLSLSLSVCVYVGRCVGVRIKLFYIKLN